jgi:hypothetical protein
MRTGSEDPEDCTPLLSDVHSSTAAILFPVTLRPVRSQGRAPPAQTRGAARLVWGRRCLCPARAHCERADAALLTKDNPSEVTSA